MRRHCHSMCVKAREQPQGLLVLLFHLVGDGLLFTTVYTRLTASGLSVSGASVSTSHLTSESSGSTGLGYLIGPYVDSGDLKSCAHPSVASPLPTEPSSRSPVHVSLSHL